MKTSDAVLFDGDGDAVAVHKPFLILNPQVDYMVAGTEAGYGEGFSVAECAVSGGPGERIAGKVSVIEIGRAHV
jgi:hypothetical protein